MEESQRIEESKGDIMLTLAKEQGYVPKNCYIMGILVMSEVRDGKDPCAGCNLNRGICHGRPKHGTA